MDEPDQSSSLHAEPDEPPPSIEIEILDGLGCLSEHALDKLAANALRTLSLLPNRGQVRVRIVDDQRMIEAHQAFSGLATTTDVLTFDLADEATTDSFNQKILDADLTICSDQAQREAVKRNHTVEQELLLYIIHGTLHCLGYNDHNETEYKRMHTMEDQLLTKAGFGVTFYSKGNNP